jgi:selenide,water dikinase
LRPLNQIFPDAAYPALLVGLGSPDDSAVYQLDSERAVISTVDFFPPVVDDPYDFGAIAAANALSDIYAMGGEPLMAINLVAYPDGYGMELLSEILRGGAEKVLESGAVIAGGHTVTDQEPKYGLAVTGWIHPDQVIRKGGARPGDQLILTKSLGTGVITTALKNQKAAQAHVDAAVKSMTRLNHSASRLAREIGVHAMTDVTGYSLLGHSHEMAHLSHVDFDVDYRTLKWLPGAQDYANQRIFPGGTTRNREYFSQWVEVAAGFIGETELGLLYDPQTSGGLLMAVDANQADSLLQALVVAGDDPMLIGEVRSGSGRIRILSNST